MILQNSEKTIFAKIQKNENAFLYSICYFLFFSNTNSDMVRSKFLLSFIAIFFAITFIFSQEKRLALVIGNANYDKGVLENPVNDAKLIAKTLDSLNFEVILATNIEDQRSLQNKIREFGQKRSQYDVGFVYYAGHGVQID